MKFFEQVRKKIRIMNLGISILFFVLTCGSVACAVTIGFAADFNWRVGLRGTEGGLPVPNWLLAGIFLVMAAFLLYQMCNYCKRFIKDTEYNKLLDNVRAIGDAETIGTMLEATQVSPYTKGVELRFNAKVLFYMEGETAIVIPATSINRLQGVANKTTKGDEYFVCVYYDRKVLRIPTDKKKIHNLLEEMQKTHFVASK